VLLFRAMSDATLNNPTPQFGTAEYTGAPGNDHCQFCHQPIGGSYYRLNSAMACGSCANKMQLEKAKDTHAIFVRAILFGLGAAFVGMILYATFEIATGIIIGYAALAVGWMVGTAMMKGSGGVGGRRYQVAAALLTYAAVSMAAIPVEIHYPRMQPHQSHQQQKIQSDDQDALIDQDQPVAPARQRIGLGELAGRVLVLGLASPFYELWRSGPSVSWAIGLLILFIGIKIAWKITAGKPVEIYGPFHDAPKPKPLTAR
jgi:uncharacterized protein (DUF983 family)